MWRPLNRDFDIHSRYFWGLLVVFLGCIFIQYLLLRWDICSWTSPDLRGQEKNVVLGIQKTMSDPKTLYTPVYEPPFTMIQYGPLYYLLQAGICKTAGLRPGLDILAIYSLCRKVNLILNLCSLGLIVLVLVRFFNVNGFLAVSAAILFTLSSQSHTWAIRPDALKNVLFLATLYFFLSYIENQKAKNSFLTLILAFLAIFTKQDMLVVGLAIGIGVLLKFPSQWLAWLGRASLLVGIFLLLLQLSFGFSLWENLFVSVNNGASFQNAKSILLGYLGTYIYVWPWGLAFAFFFLIRFSSFATAWVGLFSFLCMLMGTLAASKAGSLIAYFNEANVLFYMLIAIGIHQWKEETFLKPLLVLAACIGLVWQIRTAYIPESQRIQSDIAQAGFVSRWKDVQKIKSYMDKKNSPSDYIYTSDPFLKNVFFNQCVLPMDDIVYFNLMAGTYKKEPYIYFFQQGNIKFAIFRMEERPEDILGQSFSPFLPDTVIGSYVIYSRN